MERIRSIHVSTETHKRLKQICLNQDITIKQLIEKLSKEGGKDDDDGKLKNSQ